MKKIICLGILALFSSFAFTAPFTYDRKRKLNLTNQDFRRYIRPQLTSIKRDFFSLFNHFNRLYPKLIKGEKILSTILSYQSALSVECGETGKKCELKMQQLQQEFLRFELLLSDLEIQATRHQSINHHPNLYALWLKKHFDFYLEVLNITVRIQQVLFYHGTNSSLTAHFNRELPQLFHSLQLNYKTLFFGLLEEKKRKLLSQVYYSFILPVDKYVLRPHSPDYLKKNVESLNFAWNNFHMKISKTNYDFSSETLSLARQIHRRWVSILRIMLR